MAMMSLFLPTAFVAGRFEKYRTTPTPIVVLTSIGHIALGHGIEII